MWSDMYECAGCRRRTGVYHRSLHAYTRFLFSRYCRCISCGSEAVPRLKKRDRVDCFSQNPLALMQALTGRPSIAAARVACSFSTGEGHVQEPPLIPNPDEAGCAPAVPNVHGGLDGAG